MSGKEAARATEEAAARQGSTAGVGADSALGHAQCFSEQVGQREKYRPPCPRRLCRCVLLSAPSLAAPHSRVVGSGACLQSNTTVSASLQGAVLGTASGTGRTGRGLTAAAFWRHERARRERGAAAAASCNSGDGRDPLCDVGLLLSRDELGPCRSTYRSPRRSRQ